MSIKIPKKIILPVGGFGTRFLPATKAQPKEMLPIVDKPVIQYLVEEAVASGIKEIILVTGKGKRAIEDHFDNSAELESFLESKGKTELAKNVRNISSMASFAFVRQKEPKGIGDAILQARMLIGDKESVAIMSGDDIIDASPPALKQLIKIFMKYRAPVVALKRVPKEEAHKYGVISGKKVAPRVWKIDGLVEKPEQGKAPSDLMVVVKYILTSEAFSYLERVKPAANGEIYITGAMDKYVKDGGKFYGYEVEGEYYDCGDKFGFMRAVVNFGLKHPEIGQRFKEYLKSVKL